MAERSEGFSTNSASADEENVAYGFERAEMYENTLAGTVNPYERHLFLCYGNHGSWPSQLENSVSDPLPRVLASFLKERKGDIKNQTRVTICEAADEMKLKDGDVIIFPEMNVYRNLKEMDVSSFVEDVLVNGDPWMSKVQEVFTGSYVFVCAHNNRDRRCGVCGPILIEKFKEEIESRGLKNQVFVTACSHVGGHKYAGNVIIFSGRDGKVVGNWYGYVTPNDVGELLDEQIGKGEVTSRLWRGQMGAEIRKAEEHKLANVTKLENDTKQPQENVIVEKAEKFATCCQGANGFSCCREENVERATDKKGLGGISFCTGNWENQNVIATVAVAGALAAIAVGYAFFRKSR